MTFTTGISIIKLLRAYKYFRQQLPTYNQQHATYLERWAQFLHHLRLRTFLRYLKRSLRVIYSRQHLRRYLHSSQLFHACLRHTPGVGALISRFFRAHARRYFDSDGLRRLLEHTLYSRISESLVATGLGRFQRPVLINFNRNNSESSDSARLSTSRASTLSPVDRFENYSEFVISEQPHLIFNNIDIPANISQDPDYLLADYNLNEINFGIGADNFLIPDDNLNNSDYDSDLPTTRSPTPDPELEQLAEQIHENNLIDFYFD